MSLKWRALKQVTNACDFCTLVSMKNPKKATYKSNFIDIFAQVVYFSS